MLLKNKLAGLLAAAVLFIGFNSNAGSLPEGCTLDLVGKESSALWQNWNNLDWNQITEITNRCSIDGDFMYNVHYTQYWFPYEPQGTPCNIWRMVSNTSVRPDYGQWFKYNWFYDRALGWDGSDFTWCEDWPVWQIGDWATEAPYWDIGQYYTFANNIWAVKTSTKLDLRCVNLTENNISVYIRGEGYVSWQTNDTVILKLVVTAAMDSWDIPKEEAKTLHCTKENIDGLFQKVTGVTCDYYRLYYDSCTVWPND